ncbi:MAG: hypothetical protein A2008_01135 [Candidatus Wallbacteria bacterium GWC2_49_35]|uniref:HPt domain-containing protein n=1 Tax=Candidatus Wallbacteria bacterium GWC2_49_35 TaxID=1817813 RepID=A0A1F7WRD0_9BACT|nr:MAG: hypothetical protein A2008_01135 [Candidatus Wallbacteria bacterium GWC2_49_35]HBC75332.1 hypothetical protein [Candidatus Wallbacteria bacterium]
MNNEELFNDEEFIQLQLNYIDESIDKVADFVDKLLERSKCDIGGFDINDTFRLVHSLKGTAGTYGFAPISEVAAALENLLSLIREKKFILTIDTLSFIIDSLELIAESFNTIKTNYKKTKVLSSQQINCVEKFKNIILNYPVVYKLLFKSESVRPDSQTAHYKAKPPAADDAKPSGGAAGRKGKSTKTAVVAYNAKFTKNIVCRFLENKGYKVFETRSALEALDFICENGCDMLFTFQVLEKLNGRSLCAVMKLNDEFADVRVVFLTSDKNFKSDQLLIKPDHLIIIDDNLESNIGKLIR